MAAPPRRPVVAGLLFSELSTEEYLSMVDAYVRTMLDHPPVDAPRPVPQTTSPQKGKKAKTLVRVDQTKKKA